MYGDLRYTDKGYCLMFYTLLICMHSLQGICPLSSVEDLIIHLFNYIFNIINCRQFACKFIIVLYLHVMLTVYILMQVYVLYMIYMYFIFRVLNLVC